MRLSAYRAHCIFLWFSFRCSTYALQMCRHRGKNFFYFFSIHFIHFFSPSRTKRLSIITCFVKQVICVRIHLFGVESGTHSCVETDEACQRQDFRDHQFNPTRVSPWKRAVADLFFSLSCELSFNYSFKSFLHYFIHSSMNPVFDYVILPFLFFSSFFIS